MIESGSLTPGIDPAMFGLAPGSALRYEIPDPRLAAFVSDYHVLDSGGEAKRFRSGGMGTARLAGDTEYPDRNSHVGYPWRPSV